MRWFLMMMVAYVAAGCAASSGSYVAVSSAKSEFGPSGFEVDGTPKELLPRVLGVLQRMDVRPTPPTRVADAELAGSADALQGAVQGSTATGVELRIVMSRSAPGRSVVRIESQLPPETRAYVMSRLHEVLSRPIGG